MAKGIIYVCSTAVDGLIKIGKTTNFESRMMHLESNGYRNVAGLKRRFAIEVDNFDEIEALLDDLFAKSKVGNTELFSLDVNKVVQLLSAFQGKQIYPVNETKEEVFEQATEAIQIGMLPDGEYHIDMNQRNGNKIKAKLVVCQGELILTKGSTISILANSAGPSVKRYSNKLNVQNNVLLKDTKFTSVSIAAAVVTGRNSNGWECWKDNLGRPIDVYRNKTNDNEE